MIWRKLIDASGAAIPRETRRTRFPLILSTVWIHLFRGKNEGNRDGCFSRHCSWKEDEMGVDLMGHGGESFNWHGWKYCLAVAEAFGWEPAGTDPATWNEGGPIPEHRRDHEGLRT
jgi:hypothetical protein